MQTFLRFVAVWFVVIVFIEHFRAQFFSTTDAGPEHELEVQVLIQNLKPSSLLSVGWADIGCCKVKVKEAASIRRKLISIRITKFPNLSYQFIHFKGGIDGLALG